MIGLINWMNCIWESDLPSDSKLLASYLRSFMNSHQDIAWPSLARISDKTGLSKSTTCKYLGVLEESGWLLRDRGSKGHNTRYMPSLPKVIQEQANKLSDMIGSASHGLGSASHGLEVVRHTDTNKQVNKQVNKQEDVDLSGINIDSWNEWISHKKELGKKLTNTTANKNLSLLRKYSLEVQAEMINRSIIAGWSGIFEIKGQVKPNQEEGFSI